MAFSSAYLTSKQKEMWKLRLHGFSQADVSRELSITRQTVNRAFSTIDSKIVKALKEAAQVNRLQVKRLDHIGGYLVGYSPQLNTEAVITFSSKNGIRVWYRGEEHCEQCSQTNDCRTYLLLEAEERQIQLPEELRESAPSKLADYVLQRITEA